MSRPNRADEEIREIMLAMSVHGTNGHVHLRDDIVRCYGAVLNKYPQLAGPIAHDLQQWRRTEYRDVVREILDSKIEFGSEELTSLKNYVK